MPTLDPPQWRIYPPRPPPPWYANLLDDVYRDPFGAWLFLLTIVVIVSYPGSILLGYDPPSTHNALYIHAQTLSHPYTWIIGLQSHSYICEIPRDPGVNWGTLFYSYILNLFALPVNILFAFFAALEESRTTHSSFPVAAITNLMSLLVEIMSAFGELLADAFSWAFRSKSIFPPRSQWPDCTRTCTSTSTWPFYSCKYDT
jgi:hypothetical protein